MTVELYLVKFLSQFILHHSLALSSVRFPHYSEQGGVASAEVPTVHSFCTRRIVDCHFRSRLTFFFACKIFSSVQTGKVFLFAIYVENGHNLEKLIRRTASAFVNFFVLL